MNQTEMDAIQPHPTWDDGREGFEWCRFDAYLGGPCELRAEVTWFDEPSEWGGSLYTKPELCLEMNRRLPDGSLQTIDQRVIDLTDADAVRLVSQEAAKLLDEYLKVVEELTIGKH